MVALLMSFCQAIALEADDAYLKIFNVIQEADTLAEKGATAPALAKYQEAQRALQSFRIEHAGWNVSVVSFRAKYVAEKVAILSAAPPAAVEPAPKSATAQAGSQTETAPTDIEVKLLEAGAEPRQPLRLHPKPGDKQSLTMTTKMGMEMRMGEMPAQPVQMPSTRLVMDLTVKSVAENGDIDFDIVITDAGVVEQPGTMPQVVEAMKATFAAVKGLSGKGTTSARGIGKGNNIEIPANAAPEVRQGMEQIKDFVSRASTPLPEEPVGPGAKWEVKMPVKSQGVTLSQTATYMLVSVEGDRFRAKDTISQIASRQKIENPGMPGMKLDLTKMEGQGVGDFTFDTTHVLPLQGKMNFKSAMTMAMNASGQTQSMVIKNEMDVTLVSK